MSTTARAILAGGLVSLNVWNAVAQAYAGFGESLDADKFEIKPNFEEKVSESKSHLDYGQARASTVLPKPTEITIELSAASVSAMAMQFQGLVEKITQASGVLTGQTLTISAVGVWLPVGKRNLSDQGFALKPEGAGDDFILGTHYEVNWLRGEIRVLDVNGAPAKDDVVRLAGSYGAVDGKKILGGRVTQVRCQARFDGKNMVDGAPIEVDVHECVLGANNGFDFLGSDYSAITLAGKIVTPAGKTEGYEVRFPTAGD
jgi:hypothetical protein